MEVRPAEGLLAKSMISGGELDELFEEVNGEKKTKDGDGGDKVRLMTGVHGKEVCGGSVVGVWGDGGKVNLN